MQIRLLSNHASAMIALAFILLIAPAVFGQVETARITGTVTDSSGAVIPGATVTLTHPATSTSYTASTDGQGRYLSVPLRIGTWEVTVETDGFKTIVRRGIVLQVQDTAVVDFALELGTITEVIDVTAAVPLLETTRATQGQVIDNQRIVDMPLNGRDYTQLALLSSGTVQPIGGRFGGFSAAGQRSTQNNFLLDGVDNNNVQLAAQGRRGEAVRPSIDAIQEFKVSTNAYSAEYGRATGGVVNATIKSGSNEIHGTVFEFLRNEKLDAKNFFDSADSDKPPFKRNQFGFSLGGPIIKNKTFIFGDYEGTRIRESRTVNNTIPTALEQTGDFSQSGTTIYDPYSYDSKTKTRQPFAGNVIPASAIDRVGGQVAAWYPAPQNANSTQNFLFNPPNNEDNDKFDVRVDHMLGSSDNVYVRYSFHRDYEQASPSLPPPAFGTGADATPFTHTGQNLAAVWNHIFTPSVITSTRVAWNRIFTDRQSLIDENMNAVLGLTGVDQSLAGAPQFGITGVTNLGIGANVPNLAGSQSRQLVNDTTWTKGKHSIKFGANIYWLQAYMKNPKQALGAFTFNGAFSRNPTTKKEGSAFADLLLGIPSATTVAKPIYGNLRAPFYQFYGQDEWRVSERLTLNFGLRYDLNKPWVESRDLFANYVIDIPDPYLQLASDGNWFDRALVHTDKLNFAPRFGFAYRVINKTVLRGGYGIFYGNYEGTGGGRHLIGNPPFTMAVKISTNSITPAFTLAEGVPEGTLDPKNVKNLALVSFEQKPDWPMSQQWNFNIQQQLGDEWLWEVGYSGAKTNHQVTRWDGNYAMPMPGNINANRRYNSVFEPSSGVEISPLAQTDAHNFWGNSTFHSFQTKLEKRFSSGFSILGSYIFSKTIGDVNGFSGSGTSANSGMQDPTNRKLEKSLDDQHMPHRFVASYLYDVPFGSGKKWGSNWNAVLDGIAGGWTISGITTMTAGQPMGLSVNGDPANTGSLNRPNVVGDWYLSRDERSLGQYFNTAAFAANDPYTFGNAGRNLMLSPGAVNFDLAAFKRFRITEGVQMQFRFEAFNAFNTPHFGNPNLAVGNKNFGMITSAGRPRNMQFGLKLLF